MDSVSIPNNRKSKINYNMQPISNGLIKLKIVSYCTTSEENTYIYIN